MYIYFDGGVSLSKGMGVWVVVLVTAGPPILLARGYTLDTKIHRLELRAAQEATSHAKDLGVSTIIGDCQASIAKMQSSYDDYNWKWVPSRDNLADQFTKSYPPGREVEERCPVGVSENKGMLQYRHGWRVENY